MFDRILFLSFLNTSWVLDSVSKMVSSRMSYLFDFLKFLRVWRGFPHLFFQFSVVCEVLS